jgi:hypothetical protein
LAGNRYPGKFVQQQIQANSRLKHVILPCTDYYQYGFSMRGHATKRFEQFLHFIISSFKLAETETPDE